MDSLEKKVVRYTRAALLGSLASEGGGKAATNMGNAVDKESGDLKMRSKLLGLVLMLALAACTDGNNSTNPPVTPAPPASPPATPVAVCTPPITLINTSIPARVVGTGTPGSCTEAALRTAISAGGIITFSCGNAPVTIAVNSELVIGMDNPDVVLDGGGLVTLSGGNKSRILNINSSFERSTPLVTVQKLKFIDANITTEGGGAIKRLGGTLRVIDSQFSNNRCIAVDQDKAGGAIYAVGPAPLTIVGSTFSNNRCASGGAIGGLFADISITNSTISGNTATGNGGNPGNGGNGGGLYVDGNDNNLSICGSRITGNSGEAFGGGVFKVINNLKGSTVIKQSTIADNTSTGDKLAGGLYLQGTAVTLESSTISGNRANGAGGIYIGPGSSVNMLNTTIANNTAVASLGGGLFLDGVSGSIKHTTFLGNAASGASAFGGAVSGASLSVNLQNSVFAGNSAGNGFNPITCTGQFANGGGNTQFPVLRSGGGSDSPNALCASGIGLTDPQLEPLADNGGATKTALPALTSPLLKATSGNCAVSDQRGATRGTPCTAGATERP